MKFLMLVLSDPDRSSDEEPPVSIEQWVDEVYGSGKALDGDRLRPSSEAKTIRRREGEVRVADGPAAPAQVEIAGFDILECADLDEAVAVASRHPMATSGIIELRPAWPLDL
ncbi:YciI family protein [Microbacterium chocolatum]|uniref:YciI family protein n=1 Tax=Microbacterium aurantiacum TaxID=162393 RepID=UPI003390767C